MTALLPLARGCALASLLAAGLASAAETRESPLLLAELIVGPENAAPTAPAKSPARTQRERAAAARKDAPTAVIVGEVEEDGVLSPRGGAPAEERAFEQRQRARSALQGNEVGSSAYPAAPAFDSPNTAANRRNKARAYTGTGNAREIDLSQLDRDGVPLVPCQEVDNVSGRIGDDTLSGSIVFLVRNGQQIKVRCR